MQQTLQNAHSPEFVQEVFCLLLHRSQLLIPSLEQQLPNPLAFAYYGLKLLLMLLVLWHFSVEVRRRDWQTQAQPEATITTAC